MSDIVPLNSVKCKPFPKRQILDSSKLEKFADHNFELDEKGRKFSIPVENTVGKGETASYEQFFRFTVFLHAKDLYCRQVKTRTCLGKVNSLPNGKYFRLVQIVRICRWQNKCDQKIEINLVSKYDE